MAQKNSERSLLTLLAKMPRKKTLSPFFWEGEGRRGRGSSRGKGKCYRKLTYRKNMAVKGTKRITLNFSLPSPRGFLLFLLLFLYYYYFYYYFYYYYFY